jgi:NitT/TauT family transport system permease protein
MRSGPRFLAALAALAALGLIWAASAAALGERVLPSPAAVGLYFFHSLGTGEFWGHFSASAGRAAGGIALGFALAFPAGLALGVSRRLDSWLSPFVFLTYPAPKILFLPVLLVLLGLGEAPKIILITLTVAYQILLVTRDSLRRLDPRYLDSFKALRPPRARRPGRPWTVLTDGFSLVRHVLAPAALPASVTAMRLVSGTAVAVLFMAESFATDRGLGFLIIDAWGGLDLPRMFAGILAMSGLGLFFYGLGGLLERRFRRWSP